MSTERKSRLAENGMTLSTFRTPSGKEVMRMTRFRDADSEFAYFHINKDEALRMAMDLIAFHNGELEAV